ncbi:MAG: polysaccharide deacetylase family protein, partial [Deltaproteobacteria bacterium]|nr:polysaccharide deacetylase family protein [Deltaproteobacteria bacterium]
PLHGKVALTFDDGPPATVTPQILATLRAHNVPATFLMVGRKVDDPSLWNIADDIATDPLFDIGNHTWDHTDLALAAEAQVHWEVDDTTEAIEAFGVTPAFFRFPFGDSTCRTSDIVREDHGFLIAGWHIDTADWCYASGGTCTRSEYWRIPSGFESDMRGFILDQTAAFDGGVVLFHDTHQYTASHLEDVILDLLDAGHTFTRLDDANAFPRLNADNPYDFPWVGESCDTTGDTCWQVEYASWCEPTGASGLPVTAGVCVLPCTGAQRCIDRDGTAPLFCADVGQADDYCLARATPVNDDCADVSGTVKTWLWNPSGTTSAEVCLPYAW